MDKLVEDIEQIVKEAGEIILRAERSSDMVDTKEGKGNFVTYYDKEVEAFLKKRLLNLLPEAGFIGEEEDCSQVDVNMGFVFIVDPIDGTTNFIRDFHWSCISVALIAEGEQYIGVVYQPYVNEMFTAQKGKGAYVNGKPIHVSNEPIENALVLFGTATYYENVCEKTFNLAKRYFETALDVRRCGSAAIDLCWIAAGRADLYYEMRLQPWDFAAGSLIVTEAGGTVSDMEGNPLNLAKASSLLATNSVAKPIRD